MTHACEHKLFAGKLDASKLGLLERAAVRGAHATEGDHRDWDEINRWAEEIAGQLRRSPETSVR
jgi:menaquinone-dependent protoporphyrinogen oxidase